MYNEPGLLQCIVLGLGKTAWLHQFKVLAVAENHCTAGIEQVTNISALRSHQVPFFSKQALGGVGSVLFPIIYPESAESDPALRQSITIHTRERQREFVSSWQLVIIECAQSDTFHSLLCWNRRKGRHSSKHFLWSSLKLLCSSSSFSSLLILIIHYSTCMTCY